MANTLGFYVLWAMVGTQMLAWGWFSIKGGKLPGKKFLIFTGGMLIGQIATSIETFQLDSWRAFVIQIFFFGFTAFGGIQRLRQMKKENE